MAQFSFTAAQKIASKFYGINLKHFQAKKLCRIQTGGFAGEINEGKIWFNIAEKENPNVSALSGFTSRVYRENIDK